MATLLVMLPALAGAAARPHVATLQAGSGALAWQPELSNYARMTLIVAGPDGRWVETFPAGQMPVFSLYDEAGSHLADGLYKWELRVSPKLDKATRDALQAAREAGSTRLADDLRASGILPAATYQAGSFSIVDGALVSPDQREADAGAASAGVASESAPVSSMSGQVVLTTADGVIRNSSCVGFDCPNSPSFSDTTMLMMENNTRIKFDDTSSTASFPNNDWEIEANSNLNGGANYLGFNDCGTSSQGGCATDLVFAVESGVRQNALYVESDGDVGFGTSNPVVSLHAVDGNTPTLRLEQDGSSGFTPQTWDVAGNETNFFIRDATNGSQLPFRIQPGADSNSVFIAADNDVGVGTSAPDAALHVRRTNGTTQLHVEEASGTQAARTIMELENNGQLAFSLNRSDGTSGTWTFTHNGNQFNISKVGTGANELAIFDNGNVEARGSITGSIANPSSRALKTDFAALDPQEILAKVTGLPLLQWRYKVNDQGMVHMGPMAEDFFATFGVGTDDRIFLADVNGVALAAIQGLSEVVNDKQAQIAELQAENERKEEALVELSRRLERLEALLP